MNYLDELELLKKNGRANDIYNIRVLSQWVEFCESGKSVRDFFELFCIKSCAIYGAGVLGKRLLRALDGKYVKYFIDQKAEGTHIGVPVIKPDRVEYAEPVDLIIVTAGYDEKNIRKKLVGSKCSILLLNDLFVSFPMDSYGDIKTIFDYSIEKGFLRHPVNERTSRQAIEELGRFEGINQRLLKGVREILKGSLTIPKIDLIITTKCTLKCRKCFHLIPEYCRNDKKPFDISMEHILKDISHISESVDFISIVNVLGGEPFVYKDFDLLLKKLKDIENIGRYKIVTNGTIVPNDKVCEELKNDCFVIYINRYNILNDKIKEITAKFDKCGIIYYVDKNTQWYDFGEIKNRDFNDAQLEKHYSQCAFSQCKALMEGELHTCAFIKHAERNNIIPTTNESLHIHDYTKEELRTKLTKFLLKKSFISCKYCNAPNPEECIPIPAGEQYGKDEL